MASSSRHSYNIPGASLLRPRTSSKQHPSQGPSASSGRDRDARQASLSRAYSVPVPQEPSRSAPSARPPSANGYRTQTQPPNHQSGGYAPATHFPSSQHPATQSSYYSSSRPLHSMPQRLSAVPQASSSKTRAEHSGTESRGGVFAKMFSRVRSTSTPSQQPTPAGSGTDDNQKSSRRHKRSESAQAQPVAYLATTTLLNPPPSAPPTGRSMSEQQTKAISAREAEREERRRRKESEKERLRDERHREKEERRSKEKQRAEFAAMEARQKAEQKTAANAMKSAKVDRAPSQREEKQVQSRHNSVTVQPQQPTTYLTVGAPPGNITPPPRETQQTTGAHPQLRHPGVAIQPSNSSSQSTVSNRGYVSVSSAQGNQQMGPDGAQPMLKVPSTSAPSGVDDKARKDVEREREREDRRTRRAEREKERVAAAEKERLEIERLERERRELREKERERERSFRHRAQREKAYSLPINAGPGAMSGSDNERSNRKESRHTRSQSHSAPMVAQPYLSSTETQRGELRRGDAGYSAPQTDLNAQLRYDGEKQVVYPRTSQAPQGYPPPVPQKYEQPAYQRVVSDTGPSTSGHQSMSPIPPGRARTDPTSASLNLPPQSSGSGSGSGNTSVTMMSWPESYSSAPPRVVSIHAAQGPPDTSPARYEQKLVDRAPQEPGQPSQPIGQEFDGHPRMSSHDYSTNTGRAASASTPSRVPSAIPIPPQTVPTYSSSSSSRYHPSSSQPHPTGTTSGTQYISHTRVDNHNMVAQAEKGLVPGDLHPHGHGAPSMSTPVPSSSNAHLAENGHASSMPLLQPTQGSSPKGYPTSAQLQGNSPKVHTSSQVPSQAQQPMYVARATSSNSNNSPSQRAVHQAPGSQGGLFPPPGAVSRTPSNTSQSAVPGYSYQQPSPPQVLHGSHSSNNPVSPSQAMYSSMQNNSTNSRSSYIPSNQQYASYSSSYSQSQPQPQHTSSYPFNTSTSSLHIALPPRSDVRSSPSMQPQPNQPYPLHPSSSTQNVHYTTNPSAHSHVNFHVQSQSQGTSSSSAYYASLNSHPSSSHQSLPNTGQSNGSAAASSVQQPQHIAPLYNSNNTNYGVPDPKSQQQYLVPKSPGPAQRIASVSPSHADTHDSSKTPRPTDYASNQYTPGFSSHQQAAHLMTVPNTTASDKPPETTPRYASESLAPLYRQQSPYSSDTPQSTTPKVNIQQIPSAQSIAQPAPVRTQQGVAASTSTRVALPGHAPYHASSRMQEFDSPPPLTPSTSSHESHEEILMTPSSLDPSKIEQQEVSVTIQRPEKKKAGGIFGMFRSTSKPSKDPREPDESRDYDSRRLSTAGTSQRPEGGNKLRSMKPPPPPANQPKADNVPLKEPVKLTKPSPRHHVPPPIEIPPSVLAFRLVSSKSKRYRTMSAASLEALDGTANNTVVGSPTSTVRSPTPSGPLTPPLRDAVEAAHEWRNKEEMVYMKSGSHRRRRPGVTFDLTDDDTPPKGYRQPRVSRIYANRDEPSD